MTVRKHATLASIGLKSISVSQTNGLYRATGWLVAAAAATAGVSYVHALGGSMPEALSNLWALRGVQS